MTDSEIVIESTLEPSLPYPLPIPEPPDPVALIVEFITVMVPVSEKPSSQYPLPTPGPNDKLVAVTLELIIKISPTVEFASNRNSRPVRPPPIPEPPTEEDAE
jgi:hypothetical protein